jgi:putative transcriptional regulator
VLSGGFDDGDESFTRGDIECADQDTVHQPVAMKGEDCICLAVTTGPLKFFDLFGRVAQPFVRI